MTVDAAPSLDPGQVLGKAVLRAATELGLSTRELARTIGTSAASLSRLSHGQRVLDPASKEGELALLVVRVFRSVDALLGGSGEAVRAWMRAANTHLGGVPAERMQSVEGLVEVAGYLDAMRGKL
jgi:hypothetical protein